MESIAGTRERPIWQEPRAAALLLAASLTTMANATISPALPGIERLFADDPNAVLLTRLLVPAPSLSVALFAPVAGVVADRIGRRVMLLAGVVLFVIAGCAGFVLPDLSSIFASRLVLGIAVALIMTAQTALIGDYYTGDDRKALTGLQISARNFGGLVFISLAGWAATLSPRLPFAIYGLAALFLPLMWLAIVEPPRIGTTAGIAPANDRDGHSSWRGLLSLLVLLQGVTNMIFFLMPTQISFFLATRGYESAMMTGAVLGLLMISGGGCALLYRHAQQAIGSAGIFAAGYGAMALGFLLLSRSATVPSLFAAALLIGAGYALVSPGFIALVLDLAPRRSRGLAGGILTASIFIGQFCSPLASTPLIAIHGYGELFRDTACVLALMALAAMITRSVKAFRASR